MKFNETAIRERLAQHYVLRHRNNGQARPDLAAAEDDVRACMKEIERLCEALSKVDYPIRPREPLIHIDTVAHANQRYPGWGDWEFLHNGTLRITISEIHNCKYEYLAAIHELLEAILCLHQGITQADVDAFDIDYENRRIAGKKYAACGCVITNDPGSDKHAPYREAHLYAESVEYGLAHLLGVDPKEYDAAFIALDGGVKADEAR